MKSKKYTKVVWTDGLFDAAVQSLIDSTGGKYLPKKDECLDLKLTVTHNEVPYLIRGSALAHQIAWRGGFEQLAKSRGVLTRREYTRLYE